MKPFIFLLSICTFLLLGQNTFAQRGEGHNKERWEKYKAEKVAFLTSHLDLTPEEAQKFWPVYNQMEKEKEAAHNKRRELEQKVRNSGDKLSDKEIIALTREFASNEEKEGAINKKYNEEFLKILPPKKVLQLYKMEGEFRMYMFKKYRERGNRQGNSFP